MSCKAWFSFLVILGDQQLYVFLIYLLFKHFL